MKRSVIINFLYEESNKVRYKKYSLITIILLISCVTITNLKLKIKIDKLELYINENHKYTTVSNLDHNIDKNLTPISNLSSIIQIINESNIRGIKISHNKLSLRGYSNDSNNIKSYVDRLNKIDKINNISIKSINREGEAYSFEIESNVGVVNEI